MGKSAGVADQQRVPLLFRYIVDCVENDGLQDQGYLTLCWRAAISARRE
jgi:hypothetical protein